MASPGFGARGAEVEAPRGVWRWTEKFLNFYIKMVSSGAFWVAISYRLAACFTGIGSTRGVEIEFPPVEPMARKRSTGQKTVRITRQSL